MKGRIIDVEPIGRSFVVEIDSDGTIFCGQKSFAEMGDEVSFSTKKVWPSKYNWVYRKMFGRNPRVVKYKGCEDYDQTNQAYHILILR